MNTWDILTLVELESEPDDGNGTSCQIAAYLDVNDDGAIHINVRKSINGKVNQTSDRMWKPIIDDTWADLQKWVKGEVSTMLNALPPPLTKRI
jgi:hypothetical protein